MSAHLARLPGEGGTVAKARAQIKHLISATLAVAVLVPAGAAGVQYVFDATPPKIKIKAKKVQRPKGRTVAKFKVSCDERCDAALTGDAVVKAKPRAGIKGSELRLKRDFAKNLKAGERERMKLKTATKKAAAKLRQALEAGAKARVKARVRAEDEVGNPAKTYRRVKLSA